MGEVIKQEYCHGGDNASFDEVCSELRADMMSERERETQPIAMPSQNDTATPAVETVEHSEAESIEAEGSDLQPYNLQPYNPQPDFSFTDNPTTSTKRVEELPIWGLPKHLQNVINEVKDGLNCNRDFCVVAMFSAIATMLGKRVSSKFINYTNYATLWLVMVGFTATGKSKPLSFFFRPIKDMEKKAFDTYTAEMKEWEKAKDMNRCKPVHRHVLINNPTDEKMLQELYINGSVTWIADELRTLFGSLGKYSKSGSDSSVGNMLSIANNEDVLITRVTSEPLYIKEPNLNIFGGIQPDILKRVMGGKGYTADGFFQRFLFAFPEVREASETKDIIISEKTYTTWRDTIRQCEVLNLHLTETEEAKKLHLSTINRWERDAFNTETSELGGVYSKMCTHLCRWSIVATALSGESIITEDIMKYSIECMEYFLWCAERVLCLILNPRQSEKEPTKAEVFKQLKQWYGDINQSKMAEALGISQQAVSKLLK